MFERDRFIADCEAATAEGGQRAVRELMARTVADRASLLAGLGEPKRAGIEVLHRSKTATIAHMVWGPHMTVMPHNHNMWAVIGIYGGREDNIFWRILPPDARWPLEAAGASAIMPGEACPLGRDIIHSVTNPLGKLTGAIHVYGGDFPNQERSEWHEETLRESPYDSVKTRRLFEESNRALEASGQGGA
jgi:predicted metal-dependent enzyme (double-stranded beta helix superfamily)